MQLKKSRNLPKKSKTSSQKKAKQPHKELGLQDQSIYAAAVMGRVAKAMVHDLSTPLSALRGSLMLLKPHKNEQHLLEIINNSLDHVERIVKNSRDLLSENYQVEKFNPTVIVERAIETLRNEFDLNSISISLKSERDLHLRGIPNLFERIVINLVSNSVQELITSTGSKQIEIHLAKSTQNGINLSIKDTGGGIPTKYHELIFEPEFTLKNPNQHFGFGLTFVREAVQKYFGGNIYLESKMGEYTEFIVQLHDSTS